MNGERLKNLFANKTFRLVLVLVAALLLLLMIWKVFFGSEKSALQGTEAEQKLTALLTSIDGVENVSVMIGEEEGVPVNAVIVLGGADSLMTRSCIVDVTAAALRIEKSKIQVYPAKG